MASIPAIVLDGLSDAKKRALMLADNRIRDPGTMGVHVTESSVTARGNAITGARLDREKDMGDAFYAIEAGVEAPGENVIVPALPPIFGSAPPGATM